MVKNTSIPYRRLLVYSKDIYLEYIYTHHFKIKTVRLATGTGETEHYSLHCIAVGLQFRFVYFFGSHMSLSC